MSLQGIISIAGMTGLFKVVSQTKTNSIVESISDKKRTAISVSHKVNSLMEINVYTTNGDVRLEEILRKIKQNDNGEISIDPKAEPENLKESFKKLVPDYDEAKVYVSDMKKILSWYLILKDQINLDEKTEETNEPSNITAEKTPPKLHHDFAAAKVKTQEPKVHHKIPMHQSKGG